MCIRLLHRGVSNCKLQRCRGEYPKSYQLSAKKKKLCEMFVVHNLYTCITFLSITVYIILCPLESLSRAVFTPQRFRPNVKPNNICFQHIMVYYYIYLPIIHTAIVLPQSYRTYVSVGGGGGHDIIYSNYYKPFPVRLD